MALAPFEPAEVEVIDRREDTVVLVFRSAEGGEFPMKLQQKQVAGLISKLESGPGSTNRSPNHENLGSESNGRIVGWQVQKRRDGARRLTFAVELPDQGRTVTLPCLLIPEDVRLLASDLS
jgi:hypothetical protein